MGCEHLQEMCLLSQSRRLPRRHDALEWEFLSDFIYFLIIAYFYLSIPHNDSAIGNCININSFVLNYLSNISFGCLSGVANIKELVTVIGSLFWGPCLYDYISRIRQCYYGFL